MDGFTFGFISSHSKGGQHTNGPDYGKVTAEHEAFGIRVEIPTSPRFTQHKARELAVFLIQIAAEEIK